MDEFEIKWKKKNKQHSSVPLSGPGRETVRWTESGVRAASVALLSRACVPALLELFVC